MNREELERLDDRGMSAWNDHDASFADVVFCPGGVHEQLPLKYVEGLVRFGVHMQRGRLALRLQDLEQQEGAGRVRARGLEGQKPAVEPEVFPLSVGEHDWSAAQCPASFRRFPQRLVRLASVV